MLAVRHSVVDGLFYPADREVLRARIEQYVADAAVQDDAGTHPVPKLLISPHAGYEYSGCVAAHAYAQLLRPHETRIRRVVLIGPAHRVPVRGLALPALDAFETPLGQVRLDARALDELDTLGAQVVRSNHAHEHEHSLEVQLPFLQTLLGRFTLVPLVAGFDAQAVALAIERLWGTAETLIVVSSDLSHYLRYEQAQAVDRATVERILRLDADIQPHEACGAGAINGALTVARHHGLTARLLDLRNSGDTGGERHRVVGYAALAFEERAHQ